MNIFARELDKILKEHKKELGLGNLYGVIGKDEYGNEYTIKPNKVRRLKQSLNRDMTATLNVKDLEYVSKWADLNEKDLYLLRVALLAEAVRFMMAGRVDRDTACQIGETAFRMLLDSNEKESHALLQQLVENVRGVAILERIHPDAIEIVLEPAVEIYEQGLLWLEVARDTVESSTQQGYLALAKSLLDRAYSLTTFAPQLALSTPQQAELLAAIDETLLEMEDLS